MNDTTRRRNEAALTRSEGRVLALAGLVQAVHLALTIARDGECDAHAYGASLASTLRLQADSAEAVYDGLGQVRSGLRLLIDQLRGGQQRNPDLLRIAGAVLDEIQRAARNCRPSCGGCGPMTRHPPDYTAEADATVGLLVYPQRSRASARASGCRETRKC